VDISIKQFRQESSDTKQKASLSDQVFNAPWNAAVVHQVITAYLAAARAGTKQNKGRSDVRGGGKKPWRQKGTGRARSGTNTSPIWRTGGVTFAARPRDFAQKVNRKMYRLAIKTILSRHAQQGTLVAVDELAMDAPKTKQFVKIAERHQLTGRLYFISNEIDINFYLSSRNIAHVEMTDVDHINPFSLYRADFVVVTQSVLAPIEEWLA